VPHKIRDSKSDKIFLAFRTDTDISQKKGAVRERELQQWQPSTDVPSGGANQGDEDTFGPGVSRGPWDQFAANEKLFGVRTQFDENLYTTKLDRSAADFKEREREAQRIANEIIGVCSAFHFYHTILL
jgi:PAB1-binding protein PBP1